MKVSPGFIDNCMSILFIGVAVLLLQYSEPNVFTVIAITTILWIGISGLIHTMIEHKQ